jgi:aminopeptidase N
MTSHNPPTPRWRCACGLLLALAAALCVALPASAQPRFDFRTTPTVLPKAVTPSHVRLQLEVDPQRETFSGVASMQVVASEPVAEITLHASGLQAPRATLLTGPQRRPLRVRSDAKAGTWILRPTDGAPVPAGEHVLEIRYRGQVQASGEGLYRVDHRVGGKPARMLATQLEATEARRLMPSFDEPLFRAVFELSVRAPAGYAVLSNMPLVRSQAQGKSVLHHFAPTPPMPSYLLALAVGRFDVLQGSADGIPLRIFTAPGKSAQAQFAMRSTEQVLPFYARYFGQRYALPKLDQVAVPGVRQGAMEDWGLISYIEDALLYDPARSSPETQRGVFSMVAHEVAHQWFGNLVSVASWNEIWLNEAFATWMENKATEHFHPDWQTGLTLRRYIDRTMERDATPATRAIRSGPVDEASVFSVFDSITYTKGGAVLTMLEQWIGADAFQRGLAAYTAERRMAPATAGDLWFHIGRAAGRPVAEVAASWTDQPGFPLLGLSARCEGGVTRLRLQQSRFTALPQAEASSALWRIPVRLARGDERHTVLLEQAEQTLDWPGCDQRPIWANAGGRGFYRVDLDAGLRERLAAAFTTLPPADRVAVLSDSFALAQAGRGSMDAHFALLARLPGVDDASRAALYTLAASQLGTLDVALDGTPAQAAVRSAARALLAPELARLGWEPLASEDAEAPRLRGQLIRRLASFDDAAAVAAARERFGKAQAGPAGGLAPSVRAAVLDAIGTHASRGEFDALLAALLKANDEEERWLYAGALANGRDVERARRLLDEALAGRLPPNTASALPGAVARVPPLAPMAYEFTLEHWATLARLSGSGPFGGRYWLLPGATGGSSDTTLAQRMQADQQRLAGDAGKAPAAQMAAAVSVRAAVRARESAALAPALAGWAPAGR